MKRFKKELSMFLVIALLVTSLSLGFGISSQCLTYAGSWRFYAKTQDASWNPLTWFEGTNDAVVIKMWSAANGTGTLLYTSQDLGEPVRSGGNSGYITVTDVPTTNQIASITFNKVSGTDSWGCETVTIYYTPMGGLEQQIGTVSPNTDFFDNNTHLICNTTFFNTDHNRYITFDANGGTGTISPQFLVWGTSDYLKTNSYIKTGYAFLGWATTQAGANAGTIEYAGGANFIMPDSNPTLYTVWTAGAGSPYTVYHYKQNVEKTAFDILASTDNLIGATGSTVVAMDKFYPGFTAVNPLSTGIAASDGSLVLTQNYTRNSFLITFYANGGTGGSTASMIFEASLTAPDVTRTGYRFNEWSPAVPSTVPAENKTFIAQWSANTYTIEYDGNGETSGSTSNSIHSYDTPQALTTNGFSKTGYKFIGWSETPSDLYPAYFDNESVENLTANDNATVKLYAIWIEENSYIIIFDANGGTGSTRNTLVAGEPLTAPAVARTGYTFNGWDPVKPETVPAANTTYFALWKINQYTVTFEENGGSTVANITQDYGSPIIPPADPTKKGYTFDGWTPDVPSIMPAQNTSCTAQWQVNSYTISFDTQGGSAVTNITQDYGTAIAPPADPTREGYTFNGWTPSIPLIMPSLNRTCTAQWKVNSYTITFTTQGGSGDTSDLLEYGTEIIPPIVTKTGFTFLGWSPEIPETMPANNATYTAQWSPNSYTISFDANGGTGFSTDVTQEFATEVPLPATGFTKTGYTFIGWNTAPDAEAVLGTFNVPANDATLYAIYAINSYNAVFFVDGSVYKTVPTLYNANIIAPVNPEKTGYLFTGWDNIPAAMPADDITINALWSKIPVTLTAKAGSTAIINQSMGFIYGLEEGLSKTAFLNNFVQINGNGSLRVTYFTDSFGTQTRAELIDNETSAVVKTYYIIIFGDVDGDGYITVGDENLISLVASYQSEFDAGSAFGFAADLTQDELVDTFDLNLVSAATSYAGTIDQTNPGELI